MKKFTLIFGALEVILDFISCFIAILLAYKLRQLTPFDPSTLPSLKEEILFALKSATLLVTIFALGKIYSFKSKDTFPKISKKILSHWIIWIMAMISYYFYIRNFPFSRLAMIYGWILSIIFILLSRLILKQLKTIFQKKGYGKIQILIIGNNKISQKIQGYLKKHHSYQIVKVLSSQKSLEKSALTGKISQLDYYLNKKTIDEILITNPKEKNLDLEDLHNKCKIKHIRYNYIANFLDIQTTNIEITTQNGIPIIKVKSTPLDGWGQILKRIFDITISFFGLILLSPIFLITALAIKLDTKGPVFFSKLDNGQPVKRVGRHGKLFHFIKFRSMHPKTDSLRYTTLAKNNIRNDGPLVKIQNDPRITRVGRIIRKTSIDELPNLFAVLKGDMSLVGPRPHLPEEVAKYKDHQNFVLTIKPGITGLAQVSGRSDLKFEDEVKLDSYYIENWSLLFDIKIILKTILIIFKPFKE